MTFTLTADSQFSLAASAEFAYAFPGTEAQDDNGAMTFAWPVDGEWTTVRVTLQQSGNGVEVTVDGSIPDDLLAQVRRDLERILCIDVDGTDFPGLARRDPVVARLQARFPGLRPVLFYTPYEAAAWCIIGQRIQMTQAARTKQRLADELGEHAAFPSPNSLAQLTSPYPGLTSKKVDQLHALADAARRGSLDRDHLRQLSYDDARTDLEKLPGIGPFSSELIMIRGVGVPDSFPDHEKRVEQAVRNAYSLGDDDDIAPVVERWRPYRSWVGLLLRADQ